jgi:hypothetical protein
MAQIERPAALMTAIWSLSSSNASELKDHSRRMRRVLDRVMKGHPTRVTVQPARYSSFDPDRWWETRGGAQTEIVELQKLVLELVLHPMSF